MGQTFSRLTVLAFAGANKHGKSMFWAQCSCGSVIKVLGSSLTTKNTKSCGCLFVESKIRHGMYGAREYETWRSMIGRCHNPKSYDWKRYGGRGIMICPRWREFKNFFADMGVRPVGKTLDRVDNDGDYCPSNCRWATYKEQRANQSK
jgi:hypothetical protein